MPLLDSYQTAHIGATVGFQSKDTSTCSQEAWGIKPLSLGFIDDCCLFSLVNGKWSTIT